MKTIVDVSALLWSSLQGGKDLEAVPDPKTGQKVNSVGYGYERAVARLNTELLAWDCTPIDTILVYESGASKAPRQGISPDYKRGSGDGKSDLAYAHFSELRNKFLTTYKLYGATALTQERVEADDIIAWLVQHMKCAAKILTVDNDLMVLGGKNPHGFPVFVETAAGVNVNKYGDFPLKDITIYKSLVGDSSDNIKGVKGFGPKAWEAFWTKYGATGVQFLRDCLTKRDFGELFADIEKCPLLSKIYFQSAQLQQAYDLVLLRPEWVDTVNQPLNWQPGLTLGGSGDSRFQQWEPTKLLVDSSNQQELERILPSLVGEIAFDIETTTPFQSDDWLDAQGSDGVDVLGSTLVGFSLTYGDCLQHSIYVDVAHRGARNVPMSVVDSFLLRLQAQATLVIHNTMFEGTVLFNHFGETPAWKELGNRGLILSWLDTKLEASYVDENLGKGLKGLSQHWLGYRQATYEEVTRLPVSADNWEGWTHTATVEGQDYNCYKMDGLTAQHVLNYGCDDTICTAALHNFFKFRMELEAVWDVYLAVEIPASYIHTHAFVKGVRFDAAKHAALVKEDSASRAQAEQSLTTALIGFGWVGSVKPLLTVCDAPTIKLVHEIVTGEPLVSAIRTPSKLAKIITEPVLASAVASGSVEALQRLVDMHWKAAPVFNVGSPKQLQTLFYDVLELPIVVRNRPTDAARKLDKYAVGSPKTDNLAIEYALRDPSVSESTKEVLRALRVVKLTNTRFGLYYDTYPNFVHWKTGRIHSQHNQSSTNTRRASSSKPNLQQLSKGEKVEGFSPKIREMLIPHKRNAVIASFDFASQEVLLMAEWTHDPALESIFVGGNKKDFHSLTGVKIYNAQNKPEISYEQFVKANGDEDSPIHDKVSKSRKLAKAVNFGSQYRMAAPKLGTVLFVSKEEAQDFLDAKAEAFPVAEQWSQNEMELVRSTGTVKTLMGAVRHLGDVLRSDDKREVVKAERQAISFRIQGSAAEMTKLAEGRMWLSDLLDKHDCEYIASIHDEVLWSVAVDDLVEFLPKAHALMVENYAGMRLPIGSSCSIGWNFGEQVELKGDYSERNIKKALKL